MFSARSCTVRGKRIIGSERSEKGGTTACVWFGPLKRVSNALWMASLWRNRRRPSGPSADLERCARRRRVETVNDGEELQKERKFRTAVATSGIWWKGEEGCDPALTCCS
ncbi:hypothetical protein BSKO_04099 [Bryopsis sp. KO-2023]|nr:hypothetical protein BSKO_04099 [Bryopsis sp. KO-2023]